MWRAEIGARFYQTASQPSKVQASLSKTVSGREIKSPVEHLRKLRGKKEEDRR